MSEKCVTVEMARTCTVEGQCDLCREWDEWMDELH